MHEIVAWAVTTGEDGMRTQARGLAQAVAARVIEKTTPAVWPLAPRGGGTRDSFEPPWPDLLITCGRRSTALSRALRRASGGQILTVHVQDPRASPAGFDLVVAMAHDRIAAGPNVIKVATALHDLTPKKLAFAAALWKDRLRALGRPLVGVMIGGSIRGGAFTPEHGRRLIAGLGLLREAGARLAITPSRRTTPTAHALLREAFAADPEVFLWDMEGENPYRGILALADRLVVTSDSVSMVSEALATPHPVEVFDLGFPRHAGFLESLVERGLVRRFEGDPTPLSAGGPLNATAEAARAVRRLLQARTGVVG